MVLHAMHVSAIVLAAVSMDKLTPIVAKRFSAVASHLFENQEAAAETEHTTAEKSGVAFDLLSPQNLVNQSQAASCRVKTTSSLKIRVHTYIDLGDGGCFKHLSILSDAQPGHFISQEDGQEYADKLCPFASDSPEHQYRRRLLSFYQSYSEQHGQVPFSMNDIARVCLLGDIENLAEGFLTKFPLNRIQRAMLDKEAFCDAFLSLPLMLDKIGFDSPGLIWETDIVKAVWSFQGKSKWSYQRFTMDIKGCKPIGRSKHARLVLRALIPTYFQHVYAQSNYGMVKKGARNIVHKKQFYPSKFENELKQVSAGLKKDSGGLDKLLSLSSLKNRTLLSEEALDRDRGECKSAPACNYEASTALKSCVICTKKKFPCLVNGFCQGMSKRQSRCSVVDCEGTDIKSLPRSCSCHKAICWYFTDDFKATMQIFNWLRNHGILMELEAEVV